MANHKGSEASVYVGNNKVAEVKDWSLSQSADTIDVTIMGDTSRQFVPSLKTSEGSMTCFWDETDVDGQEALDVGGTATLNIYPEGKVTGDSYYTMSIIVTEQEISAQYDGMVERSISFTVDGDVSGTTVT